MTQHTPNSAFERQKVARDVRRTLEALARKPQLKSHTTDIWAVPQEVPREAPASKKTWLFAALAAGAFAYILATGSLSTVLIVIGIVAALLTFLVASLVWVMDNVPFA